MKGYEKEAATHLGRLDIMDRARFRIWEALGTPGTFLFSTAMGMIENMGLRLLIEGVLLALRRTRAAAWVPTLRKVTNLVLKGKSLYSTVIALSAIQWTQLSVAGAVAATKAWLFSLTASAMLMLLGLVSLIALLRVLQRKFDAMAQYLHSGGDEVVARKATALARRMVQRVQKMPAKAFLQHLFPSPSLAGMD